VLDDVVVPVDDPDMPVRPHFRHDRCGPFVVARQQVPAVLAAEVGAVPRQTEHGGQVPRRVAHKGGAVPVLARISARGVDGMPRGGGEAAVVIDGPDLVGDRIKPVAFRNRAKHAAAPAADPFVVPVGNRHVDARVAVGCASQQDAVLGDADAPTVVARAAEEFELRHHGELCLLVLADLEPVKSLPERILLSGNLALKPCIADLAVVPVVEAVPQIARSRVRIAGRPAGEEDVPRVATVVPIFIPQKQRVGRLMDDDPTAAKHQTRGNAQPVGKDGELIGPPVAVGIFANADPVPAASPGLQVVRIVDRLAHPEPAALVPVHADRLSLQIGLAHEQLDVKADRRDEMLHRLFRRQRLLHEPFAGIAPRASVRRIVGNIRRDILKRFGVLGHLRHLHPVDERRNDFGIVLHRPADSPLQQVVKARISPRPLIVPPGGVKHAPLPLRADPGPGFLPFLIFPILQHGPVRLVVLLVDVGFVPALKTAKAAQQRMLFIGDGRAERPRPVPLELGADQGDVLRRIQEAIRGAVDRDESAPPFDVVEQRPFLLRRNLGRIGVDHQTGILAERLLVEVAHPLGVGQIDAPFFEDGGNLLEPRCGLVVPLVAQEEELPSHRGCGSRLGKGVIAGNQMDGA
jgi:hypothetical protein